MDSQKGYKIQQPLVRQRWGDDNMLFPYQLLLRILDSLEIFTTVHTHTRASAAFGTICSQIYRLGHLASASLLSDFQQRFNILLARDCNAATNC